MFVFSKKINEMKHVFLISFEPEVHDLEARTEIQQKYKQRDDL